MADGDARSAAGVLAPARPRLADALACVTDCAVAWWRDELALAESVSVAGQGLMLRGAMLRAGRRDGGIPWTITDPREAWEALTNALDLVGWVDDPRRAFVDPVVGETTIERDTPADFRDDERYRAWVRHASGARSVYEVTTSNAWAVQVPAADAERTIRISLERGLAAEVAKRAALAHPATVADCVAFASDPQGITTAEAIAREVTGATRVVWRVVPARELAVRGADHWAFADGPHADVDAALAPLGYALHAIIDDAVTLLCPALG